jgi:hypothetical protein
VSHRPAQQASKAGGLPIFRLVLVDISSARIGTLDPEDDLRAALC